MPAALASIAAQEADEIEVALKELGATASDVKPRGLQYFGGKSGEADELAKLRMEVHEVDRRKVLRAASKAAAEKCVTKNTSPDAAIETPMLPQRPDTAPSSYQANRSLGRKEREVRQLLAYELNKLQLEARAKNIQRDIAYLQSKADCRKAMQVQKHEELKSLRREQEQKRRQQVLEEEKMKRIILEKKIERRELVEVHKQQIAEERATEARMIRDLRTEERKKKRAVAQEQQKALENAKRVRQRRVEQEREENLRKSRKVKAKRLHELQQIHAHKVRKSRELRRLKEEEARAIVEEKKKAMELLRIAEEEKAQLVRQMQINERLEKMAWQATELNRRCEKAKAQVAHATGGRDVQTAYMEALRQRLEAKEKLVEFKRKARAEELERKRRQRDALAKQAKQKLRKHQEREQAHREQLVEKIRLDDARIQEHIKDKQRDLENSKKERAEFNRKRQAIKSEFAELCSLTAAKGLDVKRAAMAIRAPLEEVREGLSLEEKKRKAEVAAALRAKLEEKLRRALEADRQLQLELLNLEQGVEDEKNLDQEESNLDVKIKSKRALEDKIARHRRDASAAILRLAREYDLAA